MLKTSGCDACWISRLSIMAETVPAQVIMHDLTGWFQTLMVDKGFRDGIAPDMPVVNDEGVDWAYSGRLGPV